MLKRLNELPETVLPLLRSRRVRLLAVAVPAVTTMAAILTAVGPNPGLGIALSLVCGVMISSSLFIAVSVVAQEAANERVVLAETVGGEDWHLRAQRLSPRHQKNGNLYADWYFRLRLQEELERAHRHNLSLTLLIAKKPGATSRKRGQEWVTSNIQTQLRRTDLPAILRDGSLGVILAHTTHYTDVRRRITATLASLQANVGLATFPKDGADVPSLLQAADRAAEQSARQPLPGHEALSQAA